MIRKVIILSVLITAVCSSSCASIPSEQQDALHAINSLIEKAENATNVNDSERSQAEFSSALRNFVQTYSPAVIDDRTIDNIARLLGNGDLRVTAALSLGNIGPRAKRAVPALERVLTQAVKDRRSSRSILGPSLSFVKVTCYSLFKISPESMLKYEDCVGLENKS